MSRRAALIVGGIAVVILAAVIAALGLRGQPMSEGAQPTATPSQSASPAPEPSVTESSPSVAPGSYVEYTDTAVADADGRILLFFHAPWCPQCRALEADILASGVPNGITIVKVDYDSRQDLRQQYGVTLQTTLVEVDSSGAARASHVAYDDPTLAAVLAALP
jgi:thiol-disulfide isomerase/thioredoxin